MYLRRLHWGTSTLRCQTRIGSPQRLRVVPFSHTSQRLVQDRNDETLRISRLESQEKHNGRQGEPKRSFVRPIWVFATCIPLGYGLNWALKRGDGAAAETTADGFVKYTLASKEDISSTCSIFTLRPDTSSIISNSDAPSKRTITSVQFKQPQLQIARNYTLLPPKDGQDPQELRFLIRRERNGEVSGYLHRLPVGSEVELRGLNAEYILPEHVDTVLFLAGGTGIAPAMQVADALAGEARVHLLWASRKREDCMGGISDSIKEIGRSWKLSGWWIPYELPSPFSSKEHLPIKTSEEQSAIVPQIERLKQRFLNSEGVGSTSRPQSRFLVDYYVDEENEFIQPKDVQRLLQLTGPVPMGKDAVAGKKILFVSGPEGFVHHWSSPKQWINGREVQGTLGGVLSTLNLHGWDVVKL